MISGLFYDQLIQLASLLFTLIHIYKLVFKASGYFGLNEV